MSFFLSLFLSTQQKHVKPAIITMSRDQIIKEISNFTGINNKQPFTVDAKEIVSGTKYSYNSIMPLWKKYDLEKYYNSIGYTVRIEFLPEYSNKEEDSLLQNPVFVFSPLYTY